MLSMYVKRTIIQVKGDISSLKVSIGESIFMMRMAYSILKGLNTGRFQVSNLRENE